MPKEKSTPGSVVSYSSESFEEIKKAIDSPDLVNTNNFVTENQLLNDVNIDQLDAELEKELAS